MNEKDDLAVARRYADAYAAFDEATLEEVLAPQLQFRQVNPGGYLQLGTAQAYIEATREFLENFEGHQPDTASAEPLGDRFATTSRLALHHGSHRWVMQHCEVVTVSGGVVVAIDSACSGPRPNDQK